MTSSLSLQAARLVADVFVMRVAVEPAVKGEGRSTTSSVTLLVVSLLVRAVAVFLSVSTLSPLVAAAMLVTAGVGCLELLQHSGRTSIGGLELAGTAARTLVAGAVIALVLAVAVMLLVLRFAYSEG